MAKKINEEYSANSMQELDDKMHYRKKPNLVWGAEMGSPEKPFSTMQRTVVREIYENSADESLQGYADRLSIKFFEDHSFEVQDNGRGIPVDINTKTGKSGIMQALGTLRSGRNFDSHDTKKSTGTNGLGASATTIFSKRFDVTVYRNNKIYSLSFKHGDAGFFDGDGPDAPFTKLEDVSYLKEEKDNRSTTEKRDWKTGTKIKVWLDMETFPSPYHYDDQDIIERLKGTAFLIPNLKVSIYNELKKFVDPETGKETIQEEYYDFSAGLEDMVESFRPDNKLSEVIELEGIGSYVSKGVPVVQPDGTIKNENVKREVPYHIAFSWGEGYSFVTKTYVNTVNTALNGVHLVATERAIADGFNERFSSMRGLLNKSDSTPIVEDFEEGMTLIVSTFVNEPPFIGQSKEALGGRDIQKAVYDAVIEDVRKWISDKKNAAQLELIAKKVTTASKNRQSAQAARDLKRKNNELKQGVLPSSLIDCELSGTDAAELYICEGDSAKTSLKSARDGRINALLGIRGKIINAFREKDMKKVLSSGPVQDIVKSLGAGSGADFDISNVRYGKVFFATDADVDGNAIACGLYGLFWVLFRPLVEEGRLYKVEVPLYKFTTMEGKKSKIVFARDETERDSQIVKFQAKGVKYRFTRLKGLGEMKADDLELTAISPEYRVITQITTKDLEAAFNSLSITMGDDVTIRKEWIETSEVDESLLTD